MPKPKHETLDKDTAIKTIKSADLTSRNVKVSQNEPLSIAPDAAVIVESAEYATSPLHRSDTYKADCCRIAQNLARTLRTADSSARPNTRSSSVSIRVCSCTSPELAISSGTQMPRNCRSVQYANELHEQEPQIVCALHMGEIRLLHGTRRVTLACYTDLPPNETIEAPVDPSPHNDGLEWITCPHAASPV